ncbi:MULTISPECIES: TadE family type IV pilus minor pilin [Streptomyces]|uniref:TadE family type IV pilus minor pilin n=1 Tax=Streptomyces TaxID=1883 RepID=UPI0005656AD3|nr:TadE family type IV pilus minor pilin [Streptomyces noursei]MCE4947181.1 pilus assembly protein [Streptomyces noursei]UWS73577.1 pilus assembly protein [Streptomyces noursei]
MCRSERRGRARAAPAGAGPPGGRRARDTGFVTAEAAVVLPVLVAVAAALIWGLLAACARIACVDAARAAARAAARQEPPVRVVAAARQAAPRGARIEVSREGDLVRVRVEAALPGAARLALRVGGEAVALAEETVR